MHDDTLLPFSFPAVAGKKITAAFDGGRITSDGGVMALAEAERRLGVCEKLSAVIAVPRDPMRVLHELPGDRPAAHRDHRQNSGRRQRSVGEATAYVEADI
jgi:uncharacterized protein YbbK (DUF523 family)